jgi:hypothetical protein
MDAMKIKVYLVYWHQDHRFEDTYVIWSRRRNEDGVLMWNSILAMLYLMRVWEGTRLSRASSRWASQVDHMLEACRPFGDNGHVKMCINRAFPSWCMGEHLWVFTKRRWSSEAFRLEWSLKSYHQDQAGCARQRYGLARFSFYRSQGGCWETGL